MINPTISLAEAAQNTWDCVVIGSGVAGAAAAIGIARAGLSVLLVDAKSFPRPKVCGGCLNAKSIAALRDLGVYDSLMQNGTPHIHELRLCNGDHRAQWPMPETLAASRELLDKLLIKQAINSGSQFLPETYAHVLPLAEDSHNHVRKIRLRGNSDSATEVSARIIVCADGLGHPSLKACPEFKTSIRKDSRIGFQASWLADSPEYPVGQLTMAAGPGGYVGVTRVERQQINMAAALDPREFGKYGRPEKMVESLLHHCNLSIPEGFADARWTGTPPLTQRSATVAAERVFLVGDAVGYIEPFTGEGMAWALAGATSLVPIVESGCRQWTGSLARQWEDILQTRIGHHQWVCQLLATILRRPKLAGLLLATCRWLPAVPRFAMRRISGQQPPRKLASNLALPS